MPEVTITPARKFTIEFFVPSDWDDEMGYHLARGIDEALDGVIVARYIGVEDMGYIGIEFIQNDARSYLGEIVSK